MVGENSYIQLGKFLAFGAVALIAESGTFFLLVNYTDVYYIFSTIISFWVGASIAFLLNNKFTFNKKGIVSDYVAYPRYLSVNIFGSALDAFIVWASALALVGISGNYGLFIGKAISICTVAIVSFILHKKWTFKAS